MDVTIQQLSVMLYILVVIMLGVGIASLNLITRRKNDEKNNTMTGEKLEAFKSTAEKIALIKILPIIATAIVLTKYFEIAGYQTNALILSSYVAVLILTLLDAYAYTGFVKKEEGEK